MPTGLLRAYQGASALALPFVARHRINHLRRAGLPVHRAHEILGHATLQRPLGPLVWLHAASVGETKSALPLIDALLRLQPALRILMTSATPSSAEVIASRLPDGGMHQFVPLDAGGPVRRFLKHWRPDLAIFVESEIWPNLLETTAAANLPLALVNARLSARTRARWLRAKGTAGRLFGHFGVMHCQDRETEETLHDIGLRHARRGVNLKSVLRPAQIDELALARLKKAFGDRPLWSAVSTHPGEEALVLEAHARLRQSHPDAALILVPRHPERAPEILPLLRSQAACQRSLDQMPDAATSVYLADTLGETDLWFALAPICCLCGSFTDVGGHTPFEPAAAGAALLHGPHYANHREAYAALATAQASMEVSDAASLAAALDLLFKDPAMAKALAAAAYPLTQAGQRDVEALAQQCLALAQIETEA